MTRVVARAAFVWFLLCRTLLAADERTSICQVVPRGAAQPGTGGRLVINAFFPEGIAVDRLAVIQRAIDEWEAIVDDAGDLPHPFEIDFAFLAFGGDSSLGRTGVLYAPDTGALVGALITFNTEHPFFVDPSPAEDSEFTGAGPPGYDLLTLVRREIGYALGWINGSARTTSLLEGNVFDGPRLNVLVSALSCLYVDPAWRPDDLMTASLGTGTRRAIALYPDASLVARAFGYRIRLQFVDPGNAESSDGSAARPWSTVVDAFRDSPIGIPLILAPTVHHVPPGFSGTSPHAIEAARGGASVTAS